MTTKNQQGKPKEVAEAIKGAENILIMAHRRPDADAIGSSLGLALVLESLGKDVWLTNSSPLESGHDFFPELKKIKNTLPDFTPDLTIVCDCGGLDRIGKEWEEQVSKLSPLINIDHHAPNPAFGTINYIDSEASSTASMVYKIVKELGVSLTKEVATCLYAGLAGDTGIFRWMKPGPSDFRDAADFVEAGVDTEMIAIELFGKVSASAIDLQAEALSNIEYYFDKRVVFVLVTDEMCKRHNATPRDGKDLVSLLRYVEGVICSVYIRSEDDKWSVSFRADPKKLNVADVAASLGGGGHPAAAAFRRSGLSLDELKTIIISAIEEKIS